jgi:hypothetical protein
MRSREPIEALKLCSVHPATTQRRRARKENCIQQGEEKSREGRSRAAKGQRWAVITRLLATPIQKNSNAKSRMVKKKSDISKEVFMILVSRVN